MARIFYLGAPSHINLPHDAPMADLMTATGNNTGNLLIGHAVKKHLSPNEISSKFSLSPREIEQQYDLVVIGAANFIAPYFDFEVFAKFLENINLPCVIIGLGAQAPNYGERIQIPKGTDRMLRIVAERSVSLGVRGYFTAMTLIDMGIKNVRVIGCPSMYWSCNPVMNLQWTTDKNPLAVSVNGSGISISGSSDVKAAGRIETALARLSFNHNYLYVLQNEKTLMEISRGNTPDPTMEPVSKVIARYGLPDIPEESFVTFVRRHMKAYYDVEQWIAETKQFDFVVGTRFHGCLIALLAGIPCLIFVHDSRTREMCELLRIPHVDVQNAGIIDINALYASLDLTSMKTAYRYLYQNYVQFLNENHLVHCLQI